MRKLVFSLFIFVFFLVSCEKSTQDNTFKPIGFDEMITKASVSDTEDMKASSFSVFGKVGSAYVFEGQNVSWDGTKESWTYSPIKYWKSSSNYSFRAVWPAPLLGATTSYEDNLQDHAIISDFTVTPVQSSQVDLLMSDLESITTGVSVKDQGYVTLKFRHILSNVFLKIAQKNDAIDNDEFAVTGITLTGMKDKGTYSLSSPTATSGIWDTEGASVLSCTKNYSPVLSLKKGTYSDVWNGGLLLIPQELSGDVKVVLNYNVTHGPDGNRKTLTKSINIPLPKPSGKNGWESGKKYTYRLELSETYDIIFSTPIVENWGSAQASGTIVIK